MTYIPHTEEDIKKMLATLGLDSVDQLFSDIPDSLQLQTPLNLPLPLSEPELLKKLTHIAEKNELIPPERNFLGAGAYRHYIPLVVDQIISRSEFYTAYTPYQPEISQGTLQAIYEFQSLICLLTDMEVANASMYDGASAAAEAALMALRIARRQKILVSDGLHPSYQTVLKTYLKYQDVTVQPLALDDTGADSYDQLSEQLDGDTAALVVQYPNFFGVVEDLVPLAEVLHKNRALLIVVVTEPIALGILKPPGAMAADIVVGEGQSFGIPLQYGGPYVGFFASRKKYVRQMPGRIVGETLDVDGCRGFVLTLSTREQHIRREKATSNICTNQGLCALAATITMAILGKKGLRTLAETNLAKSEYAKSKLQSYPEITIPLSGPTFNEFVIETPHDGNLVHEHLHQNNILGGMPLSQTHPALVNRLLLSVTEMNTKPEIDRLARVIADYH
ncbi:aminomethyl-transferring glycine dehydrogenase subunit GcvPA [candidate division CSSED10-310 bacterium]|uniref:Probable glycine dehydrogenase (decarboxylating) subunit 1 n=1 Tax=candidate division CSSED10-310 bacterium TaxID=2855610 RepID=A0ABV6Z2N6_UNCC1